MSSSDPISRRVLLPDDIRLLQRVFRRIRALKLLPPSPERQGDFASYLLDMYIRGMVIEDALYRLGVAAAKAKFNVRSSSDSANPRLLLSTVWAVEDDYLLAQEIAQAFSKAGAKVLGPFSNEAEALSRQAIPLTLQS